MFVLPRTQLIIFLILLRVAFVIHITATERTD